MSNQTIIEDPPRIADVRITDCSLCYILDDGREITVPGCAAHLV